ncbi:MAG: winged helix-turn-helix transcriptional regulator [Chloroflexia bacterium]|nr:winged helix-turn-helix transcriptional regulator [Chloroflexia bacterium]MDQ3412380.1 metalloregulator ArsR/SmtB family transcription factor [Chloroflexota bacterium]
MARPRKIDQLMDSLDGSCDDRIVDVGAVRAARATVPASELLGDLAGIFAALGDPTRLRIVAALSHRELCVCDLAATIRQTESAVSHQLRLLRSLGLVQGRRAGRRVYYTLDDQHVGRLYGEALDHVRRRAEGVG